MNKLEWTILRRSGMQARRWRERIAMSGTNPKDYTRTLKFPLDRALTEDVFTRAKCLYDTTDGVGRGSLFYYIACLHTAGFRFSSRAKDSNVFRLESLYPNTEFQEGLKAVGYDLPEFTVDKLFDKIESPPRKREGSAIQFTEAHLLARLLSLLSGTGHHESKGRLEQSLESIARELTRRFTDWNHMKDNLPGALEVIDTELSDHGLDLPRLAELPDTIDSAEKKLTHQSPLAFDPRLVIHNQPTDADDVVIHVIMSNAIRRLRHDNPKAKINAGKIKPLITTQTHNALSWVLGNGWQYWKDTPLDTIMQDYGVEAKYRPQIQRVIDAAQSIPEPALFGGEEHYGHYRSSIGGRIDSWISNYVKRLEELRKRYDQFPDNYDLPLALQRSVDGRDLFGGIDGGYTRLADNITLVLSEAKEVEQQLALLSGERPAEISFASIGDAVASVDHFCELLKSVAGDCNKLKNNIEQKVEQLADKEYLKEIKSWQLPKWLKQLPAMNRFSGGVPQIDAELAAAAEKFDVLYKALDNQITRLEAYAEKNHCHPLAALIVEEIRDEEHRDPGTTTADERARRLIFHRWAGAAKNGSSTLRDATIERFKQLEIFCSKKDLKRLNQCLINRKGAIYRSLYSTSRHEPFELNQAALLNCAPYTEVVKFVDEYAQQHPTEWRDILALKRLRVNLLIKGLDKVPLSEVDTATLRQHSKVPATLKYQLKQDKIYAGDLNRYVNLYFSELFALVVLLFRKSHLVRLRFQRIKAQSLFYCAKQKAWSPPARLTEQHADLRGIFSDNAIQRDAQSRVLPYETLVALAKHKLRIDQPLQMYLRQAPHDWYIDLNIKIENTDAAQTDSQQKGVQTTKGKFTAGQIEFKALHTPARLIGPTAYKGVLERAAMDKTLALSEYSILLEGHYSQTADIHDGRIEPKVELKRIQPWVAIPVKQSVDKQPAFPLSDHVVAIDLGEAGIGYAVFDVKHGDLSEQAKPLSQGTIRVSSTRKLIKRVQRHRKITQPRQRFQQRYNTALEQMRKNAVGDVCHAIDNLCAHYRAFPILESSVRNLASGSKQLELVYDKVLNRYTFSDIDAHKTERKSHWGGTEQWKHPYLKVRAWDASTGTYKGKPKPLNLFPGVSVYPAGTSQECSECRRNPVTIVRDAKDKSFTVSAKGLVTVGDYELRLRSRVDPEPERRKRGEKQHRRQKTRAGFQWDYRPGKTGKINRDDLIKAIKAQLRRPPESTRSKDTTQSQYHCVFTDCENVMHADVNAAINIGRKYFKDKDLQRGQ